MITRRAFIPLIVVLLVGCSADTAGTYHSLRRWPMDVPGMMGNHEPASASENGEVTLVSASENSEATPTTEMMCGTVFWCCYRIGCPVAELKKGQVWSNYDFPICPAASKRPSTRHEAWHIWLPRVIDVLYYANGETRSQCVIQEATCSYEPQGRGICWNWPN